MNETPGMKFALDTVITFLLILAVLIVLSMIGA